MHKSPHTIIRMTPLKAIQYKAYKWNDWKCGRYIVQHTKNNRICISARWVNFARQWIISSRLCTFHESLTQELSYERQLAADIKEELIFPVVEQFFKHKEILLTRAIDRTPTMIGHYHGCAVGKKNSVKSLCYSVIQYQHLVGKNLSDYLHKASKPSSLGHVAPIWAKWHPWLCTCYTAGIDSRNPLRRLEPTLGQHALALGRLQSATKLPWIQRRPARLAVPAQFRIAPMVIGSSSFD